MGPVKLVLVKIFIATADICIPRWPRILLAVVTSPPTYIVPSLLEMFPVLKKSPPVEMDPRNDPAPSTVVDP
jgi:hypothetical protein